MRQNWISLVLLVLSLPCLAQGQSSGKMPGELKPSLEARLALYTKAQAEGRWDAVANMLGMQRGGGKHAPLYTPAHKACLIAQMQTFPMTSFIMKDSSFSTEILSMPMSKRYWFIGGDAVFKTESGEKKTQIAFTAYRNQGQWYFTPPNIDASWEKTHLTEADLSADYADEIAVHRTPTCPLEFVDLHATLDKQFPSTRNLTFKLRNRSTKKVTGYTLRLYTKGGDQTYSTSNEIQPGSSRDEKMDSTRYN